MSDYDYLNTRVRFMNTRLISREFLEQILSVEGVAILIDALLDTSYREELREHLQTTQDIAAVETALSQNLSRDFRRLRQFAPEKPRRLIDVQLGVWEVANVIAIARGRARGADSTSIMGAMVPTSWSNDLVRDQLPSTADLAALIGSIHGWDVGLSQALREAVQSRGEVSDTRELERILHSRYFAWASSILRGGGSDQRLLQDLIARQVDLVNLMVALRGVRDREAGHDPFSSDPIRGGHLSKAVLDRIRSCHMQEDALEIVGQTYFAPAIEKGILDFGRTRSLGKLERFLEEVVIESCCRAYRSDPLGIGVAIGYLWRKLNEVINLRIILRGKACGIPVGAMREELLFV